MNQQFTIGSLLIPCLIFAFGLYVGIVPAEGKRNQSLKRTILCGIGIALGLFLAISALTENSGHMNTTQAYYYLCSISINGWCIYAFYTNHSRLSKWKKFFKVIIYWFVTSCFLTSSSQDKDVRSLAEGLGFILPIIAYYSGLIDKSNKERKALESRTGECNKARVQLNTIRQQIKKYGWIKLKVIDFYNEHRKVILIVIAIIIFLVILPFILRLINAYWEYVRDYAGFETKSYKRYR